MSRSRIQTTSPGGPSGEGTAFGAGVSWTDLGKSTWQGWSRRWSSGLTQAKGMAGVGFRSGVPCCGEGGAQWGRAGSMGVGVSCQFWEPGEQGGSCAYRE